MKKLTKILAVILTMVLIGGTFASCGSENKVSTGGKYTYWVTLDGNTAQTLTSFNEHLMYQEMQKRTGTEVEFIHPAKGSTGSEAFQILMASGDFPDMIEYYWRNYAGGPDQAINDGVIIALNDYLEDYAPNYYSYMEGKNSKEKDYKLGAISNDGNYYGFKDLRASDYAGFEGLYVRADLLKKWGLDIPETIDDWENVFKVAKENGIKYPLTCNQSVLVAFDKATFQNGWNVGGGYYLDGKTVKFGPFQPEYKEYIKKMNEWVKKGYIDIDFVTNDITTIRGALTNGTSIASQGGIGGDLGTLLSAMKERDPEYDLVACPYPVMKKGDMPRFQWVGQDAGDPCVAISVQCGKDNEERYKEAINFCDYLYSDEGIILKNFGVEGDTFTIEKDENGEEHYVYTDKVVKNYDEFGASNLSAALYHFVIPANHPGFSQHPDYFRGYYEYAQQREALDVWNKYLDNAKKYVFPLSSINYTSEEAAEISNIEFAANDNLKAAICDMILGKRSIDDYDEVVKEAKKAGYDRHIEINQAAYNRYISMK